MTKVRRFWIATSGVGLGALAVCVGAIAAPPPEAPGKFFGAASCAGSNCHSVPEPRPVAPFLQEFTTWSAVNQETGLPYDRHAYAFNRLYEESSKTIMAALNKLESTTAEAAESERCLTCHGVATQDYGSSKGGIPIGIRADLQGGKFAAEDGVSCDGCHGPAEKWLKPHAEKEWAPKTWKALGSEKLYNEWGIYYSKDLALWANQCVRCHLAIDTNMLDAGHPDLVPFELAGQSQAVPPHWREYGSVADAKELPGAGPFHNVRVWQTGQLAAVNSAAKQVVARAKGGKYDKPSPDRIASAVERAVGHWTALKHALKVVDAGAAGTVEKAMQAMVAAGADGAKVGAAAEEVVKATAVLGPVARKLADHKTDDAYVKGLLAGLSGDVAALENRRNAEQIAMGLYAVWYAWLAKAKPEALADAGSEPVMAAVYEAFGALQLPEPHKDETYKAALGKVKAGVPK